MRGADVREVFETILPEEALLELVRETDFHVRERKFQALEFVRSAIIAAASGHGGRQAAILRQYYEMGGPKMVRGAGYARFGEKFEKVMSAVTDRALEYAHSLEPDLPGVLGRHVRDWIVVDSTTVRLDDALEKEYPGTGDYAALKVHKLFSVGIGTTIDFHISPARDHDAKHFEVDEAFGGHGVLADLGYASLRLLRQCERHDVRFVIRLKENWKPRILNVESGELSRKLLDGAGEDLDALLTDDVLKLEGKDIDADVRVGGPAGVTCRLVAVLGPDKYCWYLTNLPRDVTPDEVRQLYAVRWEIELDNKLDKSCHKLDEIGARTGSTVRALVHASIVASMLTCLIAHHHRIEEGPPPRGRAKRTRPPIHPQTLAKMVAQCSVRIAMAFALSGKEADAAWDQLADILHHQGTDPNWRRRPSVLDQLRGWVVQPAKPRKPKAGGAGAKGARGSK